MELSAEKNGVVYAIARLDSISRIFNVKLLFGFGCEESQVYTDSAAVTRYDKLNFGFDHTLSLYKKQEGKVYKYSRTEKKFVFKS